MYTLVVTFENILRMFNFKPFGGSVTTFKDLCKMPIGNDGIGSVVIHSLKSGCVLVSFSSSFSSSRSHRAKRWQFCSKIHKPRPTANSSNCIATGSWPWPRDRIFSRFKPNGVLSASFCRLLVGSEPGLRMKMTGVNGELCSSIASNVTVGGVTYLKILEADSSVFACKFMAMQWIDSLNFVFRHRHDHLAVRQQ